MWNRCLQNVGHIHKKHRLGSHNMRVSANHAMNSWMDAIIYHMNTLSQLSRLAERDIIQLVLCVPERIFR